MSTQRADIERCSGNPGDRCSTCCVSLTTQHPAPPPQAADPDAQQHGISFVAGTLTAPSTAPRPTPPRSHLGRGFQQRKAVWHGNNFRSAAASTTVGSLRRNQRTGIHLSDLSVGPNSAIQAPLDHPHRRNIGYAPVSLNARSSYYGLYTTTCSTSPRTWR